jgi:predicted ATPase
MINKWKLFNFKSVERAELPLSPLTLFAGANSSGKSTFLQSVLLVSQTFASRVPSQTVVLNGHLAKLGQFDDLRNATSKSETIKVAWDLSVPAERAVEAPYLRRAAVLDTVSCDIRFGVPKGGSAAYQLNPRLFEAEFSCAGIPSSGDGVRSFHSVRLTLKPEKAEPTSESSPRAPWTFDYDIEFDQSSLDELRDEVSSPVPMGCSLQHFLPQWLIVSFDEKTEIIKALTRPLVDPLRSRSFSKNLMTDDISVPLQIVDFLNEKRVDLGRNEPISSETDEGSISLTNVLMWVRNTRPRQKAKVSEIVKELAASAVQVLPEKQGLTTIEMPPLFRDAIEYLAFFFSRNVRYLGPLREEPRPMYPLQNTADPQDIGLHGEHTAAVFHNFQHSQVHYIPSLAFTDVRVAQTPRGASLREAVFDWLTYLDVATKIETKDEGKFGHALAVSLSSEMSHDLTHVGVGVSQILPIVVMCLLANGETTFVLEQPELHLNPKVQTRLGDFFLSMSLLGKQCLIETHSEYLINRLRFRAAAAPSDSLSKLMALYFVEKQHGATAYRNVKINEFGAIVDWPAGFFDQSQREVEDILLAATKKAKAELSK